MLVRQFPKSIIPYLLDYIPKLRINYVEFEYNTATINSDIIYLDHALPLRIYLPVTTKQEKYVSQCDTIDQIMSNIESKTISTTQFTKHIEWNNYYGNKVTVDNSIKIGEFAYSFDCSNAIIELFKYAKLIGFASYETEYIKKLYAIYMKYYPDAKMDSWNNDYQYYNEDLEELFKVKKYYGHRQFDFEEYELFCQKKQFEHYFPVYYYFRNECLFADFNKLKNHDKGIVTVDWKSSYCCNTNESTDIRIAYLYCNKN